MLPNVPGGRIPRAESACSTFHGSSERLQTSASRSCLLAAAPDCCPPCPQPRLLLDPQGHGPRVERWGAGHWWLSSRDPRVMQGMESRRWLSLLLPALPSSRQGPSQLSLTILAYSLLQLSQKGSGTPSSEQMDTWRPGEDDKYPLGPGGGNRLERGLPPPGLGSGWSSDHGPLSRGP